MLFTTTLRPVSPAPPSNAVLPSADNSTAVPR
jgi:hypothetical protein